MRRLVPGPAADAALSGARMAPRPGVLAVGACALLAACGGCASPAARPSGRAAPAVRSAVTRGDPRSQIQDAYAGLWHAYVLAARTARVEPPAGSRCRKCFTSATRRRCQEVREYCAA